MLAEAQQTWTGEPRGDLIVDGLEPSGVSGSDLAALRNDGFVILRRYLDPWFLAAARSEYEEIYSSASFGSEVSASEPVAVFWTHILGGRKKTAPLALLPNINRIVRHPRIVAALREVAPKERIRLLETIVFDKPPREGGALCWHQDSSFYPLDPPNQYSMWVPVDVVERANGALLFARGSHTKGL